MVFVMVVGGWDRMGWYLVLREGLEWHISAVGVAGGVLDW
jgi:hypothetical protein